MSDASDQWGAREGIHIDGAGDQDGANGDLQGALLLMVQALSSMQEAMKTMELKMERTDSAVLSVVQRMQTVENKLDVVEEKMLYSSKPPEGNHKSRGQLPLLPSLKSREKSTAFTSNSEEKLETKHNPRKINKSHFTLRPNVQNAQCNFVTKDVLSQQKFGQQMKMISRKTVRSSASERAFMHRLMETLRESSCVFESATTDLDKKMQSNPPPTPPPPPPSTPNTPISSTRSFSRDYTMYETNKQCNPNNPQTPCHSECSSKDFETNGHTQEEMYDRSNSQELSNSNRQWNPSKMLDQCNTWNTNINKKSESCSSITSRTRLNPHDLTKPINRCKTSRSFNSTNVQHDFSSSSRASIRFPCRSSHSRVSNNKNHLHKLSKRSLIRPCDKSTDAKNQRVTLGKGLLRAAQYGCTKEVRKLLQQGADPNFCNKMKWTPLHKAVMYRNTDVVTLLLEKGVDLNARNQYGSTALHLAARHDPTGLCACFLIYAGCNVNCLNQFGRTPLHYAAESGNMAVVRALLVGGASTALKDIEGRRPCELATTANMFEQLMPNAKPHKSLSHRSTCPWKL